MKVCLPASSRKTLLDYTSVNINTSGEYKLVIINCIYVYLTQKYKVSSFDTTILNNSLATPSEYPSLFSLSLLTFPFRFLFLSPLPPPLFNFPFLSVPYPSSLLLSFPSLPSHPLPPSLLPPLPSLTLPLPSPSFLPLLTFSSPPSPSPNLPLISFLRYYYVKAKQSIFAKTPQRDLYKNMLVLQV